jgi:N-methylhydantoinase B
MEVVRNYLRAIHDEMARTIERTAMTPFVKETGDLAAMVFSPNGEHLGFPWRIGSGILFGQRFDSLLLQIRQSVGDLHPGDIIITNDPYQSGTVVTHLPDVTLVKPYFSGPEIIAYGMVMVHAADVGGRVPGSVSPTSKEVYEEGLRLRPVKLYGGGRLVDAVQHIIADNSRVPVAIWGDISACVSALNVGEKKMTLLVERFGQETLTRAFDGLLDHVAQRARHVLSAIPDGSYGFVDYMDEDLVDGIPIRIEVTMHVRDGHVDLDFTGTDSQVASAVNFISEGRPHPILAQPLIAFIITKDPSIPWAGSVMRPITMTLPPGTIVNAELPAACGQRTAPMFRISDCILGALAQAVPGEAPASTAGCFTPVVCATYDPRTGERLVNVVEPIIGGAGAAAGLDGADGCDPIHGFVRNTPVEIIEAEMPVLIRAYSLVPDSGGPGQWRGGAAIRLDFESPFGESTVLPRGLERMALRPWGIAGGGAGTSCRMVMNAGTERERTLGRHNPITLSPGDVLTIRAPAGGGYGSPLDRDPDMVLRDLTGGRISAATAADVYGVVIVDGEVDRVATQARRAEVAASGATAGDEFTYGPERIAFDAVWPADVARACALLAASAPVGTRQHVRRSLFMALTRGTSTKPHLADVERAWAALSTTSG